MVLATMETDTLTSTRGKLRHSRRLSSTRGLKQRTAKNNPDSSSLSKSSRACKQEENLRLSGKTNDPGRGINWELNEKISLSSGSSTGIEIHPDTYTGIGFTERAKASSSPGLLPASQDSHRLHQKPPKLGKKIESVKKSLELLNVSGFPPKSVCPPQIHPFKEIKDSAATNIIKSDCKYEIGIPGECTISRKKRQDRRKIEKEAVKSSVKTNVDLTGTMRRRWIPSNQKIDDSIAKRLELIHELNQKIIANYERFQAKSKKTSSKIYSSGSNTYSGCKEDQKNSLRRDSKNRTALSDLQENSVKGNSDIYSEVKRKNKSDSRRIVENAVVHREQENTLEKKRDSVFIKVKVAKDNGNPEAVSQEPSNVENVNMNIKSTSKFLDHDFMGSRDEVESNVKTFENGAKSFLSPNIKFKMSQVLDNFKTRSKIENPVVNDNFSLAKNPLKVIESYESREKFDDLNNFENLSATRDSEEDSKAKEPPTKEVLILSEEERHNSDITENNLSVRDNITRLEVSCQMKQDKDKSTGRSNKDCSKNSQQLYQPPDINFRKGKDELYSASYSAYTSTPVKTDHALDFPECKPMNIEFDDKSVESTELLEKEILDKFNETIGKFDCEKASDLMDEGAGSSAADDNFSDDSIQMACSSPVSVSNKENSHSKDTSHQETFNSSWDSGVGIDVGLGNGWVRIHTGIESSLVYLTLDTTAKDICRDMLLGDELSIYIQYGGEMGRRMAPDERPLEHQDEFLKLLGYDELSRRARLGVDPELRHLIAFHIGPTEPHKDLTGHSRCGNVLVLKGLVFPQWKKRVLAVIGSRLFLYPGCPESRPEWIELQGGAVCYAPSRLGKLVLRVTGYPRIYNQQEVHQDSEQFQHHGESRHQQQEHHRETRHLYLGFHHPWDRDLWRSWLKQATQLTGGPKKLDLCRNGLLRIPESVLAFNAVEEILLGHNQLANPDNNLGLLKRFRRLHVIQLERNQLKSFPRELIELEGLTSLDLSDNKIEQVPNEIYRLVNLRELTLDRNEIKELPVEVELLKKLTSFSIAGNKLTDLPSFLKMRALTLDVLTKGDLAKFREEKNNQNYLHKVNLRNNQLKGNIILGNYGNLTHLDVSENSIEKLDLSALQELQSARCARNSLTELTVCGRNLVSLIAGHNKLKKLTIEPTPTNLEHLDVSYNCLDALPEWISDLPVLRALFVSHNDLTALPDRLLSQPSRLEVLHLPHNRLQALPPPRKPLNIVHLTLQGNALTALPTTFFQNTERLKVLNLSNNRLSELTFADDVTKNRSNVHALEKLYLTGNCLTDASLDALSKLTALHVLHLAYNVLDTLPESCIASWPDLEELVLSGNRLQYLPDNVANLQHLRVLRVHSNRLLTCPTFNKTTSLMVLDLAHNQLDRVNLATLVPPQLQFLDISCNSRLHVDPRQFQVYRSQRPVSLIDVSGQNRPSLPSHPLQQEIVSAEKGSEHPWRLGFSETAGTREKLYISQVRIPSFCNIEGLFGIFDGGTNQEAPSTLQEMIPRLLLEERTIRETSKEYLKYTLLSAHRELKEKGQKYGVDATLVHITKLPAPAGYPRNARKYCLKVASSGETKAVLCRASGPFVLAPARKTPPTNQLGNAAMFPMVVPDPTTDEVILEDDDEFVLIANRKLWEVFTMQEAVREVRAEANPVLAAKRLQDLAQAYGAEDNLSIIVIRLTPGSGDLDQLMRELRHAVTKTRNHPESGCTCPCCVPPAPHKSPAPCCCHGNVNESFYLNGVLKNIVNRSSGPGQSRQGSGRYFKNTRTNENASPPFRDDRSSPSGQSDQTTDSTFKSRQNSGRAWVGSTAARAASKNRSHDSTRKDNAVAAAAALSEEQFRCWEYMLEQNTHMLFDKELDTLSRLPLRRGQSRSTPQLANLPFLSKRFGSARSFNPPLPRPAMIRFGSGRRFLNGGPNAAYFGSLQRLMPYNLEYDFAVIQERGGLDSLEQDASRMQQYWGVATTEL
ncbi:PH domain leucine-rich repeat protein phosphatase 1 [Microplitis demolitor]|uniref:PH domain leucine-rich repeat protein phosphatase 1 n=1 Tax=Microplitis demolitor TaxID=69319 RepID=UPI0004CD7BF8|nr:PH domain leucine-rich repeat protein phosphatase 1 [Microplitis demolitor]XP_053596699.1 PH domain leucine-rich repeat protein phosphatase 1 [Microplitis demolitor]